MYLLLVLALARHMATKTQLIGVEVELPLAILDLCVPPVQQRVASFANARLPLERGVNPVAVLDDFGV